MPTEPTPRANKVIAPEEWRPPAGKPLPDRPTPAVPKPPGPQPAVLTVRPHGPWPALTFLGHSWAAPTRPATPAAAGILAAAAAVAAISVPLDNGGIGWLIAAVAGVAALAAIRRLPARPRPADLILPEFSRPGRAPADPVRYAWTAATVALLGVGSVRAAGWLVVLCLLTALVTGSLAVVGGRSMRAMAMAVLVAALAPFRALPWVRSGLDGLRGGTGNRTRVAASVATAIALLAVFGGLFASADDTFARLVERAVPDLDGGSITRWVFVFIAAGGVLGGSAYLRASTPNLSTMDGRAARKVTRFEWAFPLSTLVVLFAVFVAVQLTVLFGGFRHVMETEDLTFAGYARSGFWQLLVVTGLTLIVLAGAARWAPRESRTDRILIRAILGALAVLTLVIVASALHRMNVYSDTYGLTRLRLLVALCEVWLGAIFVMILIAGVRLRGGWLPRVAVAAGVLALLGLAAANPDGLIADRNVARFEQTGRIDAAYLSDLSDDAVPALDRLDAIDPVQRDCILAMYSGATFGEGDWRAWSYSRGHAHDILAADPPPQPVGCPNARW